MAEDVCDSWEEMIENGSLDSRLEKMKFESSQINNDNTHSINLNGNGIKILRRAPSSTRSNEDCKEKNKGYDFNNYVNSEPFIPSHPKVVQIPQILFEDNARTQYVPQVKILKRPKDAPIKKANEDRKSTDLRMNPSGNAAPKSYEEREAEYAKVRLRILGSAVPDYQDEDVPTSNPPNLLSQRANGDNNYGNKAFDVPIIRSPHGPDGSRGFANRR